MYGLTKNQEQDILSEYKETVDEHVAEVRRMMDRLGYHDLGMLHDISKYGPIEFEPYAMAFNGKKKIPEKYWPAIDQGMEIAWMHHQTANKHHWEAWLSYDPTLQEVIPLKMDFQYVVEMFCDYLSAGKVYNKNRLFTKDEPLKYFEKSKDHITLNKDSKDLIEIFLRKYAELGEDGFVSWFMKNEVLLRKAYGELVENAQELDDSRSLTDLLRESENFQNKEECVPCLDDDPDFLLLRESLHLDTILTMPFDLGKKDTFYHYSKNRIDGAIEPKTVNIGNRLSPRPRKSVWLTRDPNNWAFPIMNFIKSNHRDLWKKDIIWGFEDAPSKIGSHAKDSYKECFVAIKKDFFDEPANRKMLEGITIYRYSKELRYADVGRGTEFAVDEWTYDGSLVPDGCESKDFSEIMELGYVRVLEDADYERCLKSFNDVIETQGRHFNSLNGRGKEWFKYDFDRYGKIRDEYEKSHGVPTYREAHTEKKQS